MRQNMASSTAQERTRTVREGGGDTLFGIDQAAEDVLLRFCEEWGREVSFRLIAEGIEPEGRCFGEDPPAFRLIVDPVDGSRMLMHDKRSAWTLAALAREHGGATRMEHVFAAAMTELPTTKQGAVDSLWANVDGPALGRRTALSTGNQADLDVTPSQLTSLHHGFATVCDFVPGGKEILGSVADRILEREMGGWDPQKADVFSDQYICSAGQLAELATGRDRFVLDIRPLVYKHLGVESSLCCRPYDLCTMLVAQRAGVIVCEPDGSPLNPPLDVVTNISFAAYANQALATRLQPIVTEVLKETGLIDD